MTRTHTRLTPIVLIHGLWMTPLSWEHWVERYDAPRLQVLAPAGPAWRATSRQLRARSLADRAPRRSTEIVDHYDAIIRGLDQPPIIMGHSFGGAFTQILLDRGLGAAGVAIDCGAGQGHPALPLSTLQVGLPGAQEPGQQPPGGAAHARASSTTRSPTRSPRRSRGRSTSATPSRARAACCSRARSRTSTRTRRPRSTSATTTARRCC